MAVFLSYQARVWNWCKACFVSNDSLEPTQRAFRFIEEAAELAQAAGVSEHDAIRIMRYVYGRPVGICAQEVGGTMVTLAALCQSLNLSLEWCAEAELDRCLANIEKIRAKDLAKPKRSPLPESS